MNLTLFIFGIFLLFGCTQELPANKDSVEVPDEKPIEEPGTKSMTPELCNAAYGHWNECGSPCAGTDAEICVAMCAQQCECGGIAGFGCPEGYNCRLTGKIADEMGVCVSLNKE